MSDSQRNLLILLAVAVVGVLFSGVFGIGAGLASMLLNLAFTIVIIWFLVLLYTRNSGTINAMAAKPRLLLQGAALVLGACLLTGMLVLPFLPFPFGWSSAYPVAFWGIVLLCGFTIWWAWQQRTSRW